MPLQVPTDRIPFLPKGRTISGPCPDGTARGSFPSQSSFSGGSEGQLQSTNGFLPGRGPRVLPRAYGNGGSLPCRPSDCKCLLAAIAERFPPAPRTPGTRIHRPCEGRSLQRPTCPPRSASKRDNEGRAGRPRAYSSLSPTDLSIRVVSPRSFRLPSLRGLCRKGRRSGSNSNHRSTLQARSTVQLFLFSHRPAEYKRCHQPPT